MIIYTHGSLVPKQEGSPPAKDVRLRWVFLMARNPVLAGGLLRVLRVARVSSLYPWIMRQKRVALLYWHLPVS